MQTQKLAAVLLLLAVAGFARDNKDRERVYDAPLDKVWLVCVQVASEKYVVLHSDKADGVFAFSAGSSFARAGTTVGVTVVRVNDEQTKVVLNPQKLKALDPVGDAPKKFLDAVEKALQTK